MMPEAFITIVYPPDAARDPSAAFRVRDPDVIAVCCFFADDSARSKLLRDLRTVAGQPPVAHDRAEMETAALIERYTDAWESNERIRALAELLRWRTCVHGRGYHTYTLKEGSPPYPYGVIISFSELDRDTLRLHLAEGHAQLLNEKNRVMDIFGWGITRP